MANVLIWKDEENIKKAIEALDSLIPFMQKVHDEFRAINITLTEAEMILLFKEQRIYKASGKEFIIEDFVKDRLLESMSEVKMGGVIALNKQKIRELMELPDLSELKKVFNGKSVFDFFMQHYEKVYINDVILGELILLDNNVFKKERTANKTIEDIFSYKTKTAKGDRIVYALEGVCEALNEWLPVVGLYGILGGHINDWQGDGKFMKGVMILADNTCVPSVQFVQIHDNF